MIMGFRIDEYEKHECYRNSKQKVTKLHAMYLRK